MFSRGCRIFGLLIVGLMAVSGEAHSEASPQQAKRPFTVADEIGLALFPDHSRADEQVVRFSPNGRYFAVYSERGRLDLDRLEDSLRFYRTQDVKDFLDRGPQATQPLPVWIVTRANYYQSPVMSDWRWLVDSSGVVYLERQEKGNQRLVFADLGKMAIEPLTSATENVEAFDLRDRQDYVYTSDDAAVQSPRLHRQAIVGTGRPLTELLFPEKPFFALWGKPEKSRYTNLWAVVHGSRFKVKKEGSQPLAVALDFRQSNIFLSPDGRSVVAPLAISEVPESWERLYPPPYPSDGYRVQSGKIVHQFVLISLETGSIRSLTNAPVSHDAGSWAWVSAQPTWSADGQAILLPGTFLVSKDNLPSRPCVAVVDLLANTRECVQTLGAMFPQIAVEQGPAIADAHFLNGDRSRVAITAESRGGGLSTGETVEYQRLNGGLWQVTTLSTHKPSERKGELTVTIEQGLDKPPTLVATNDRLSRVVWDPNPELKNIDLGQADVYLWTDEKGRQWKGGLYKPAHYRPGERYPLVIQTHGFIESEFRPSGILPSGFAARELAAVGIAVLQVSEHLCPYATPQETECAIAGYEAGANQLVSQGLVDPERIGIIGFSRTGAYVMEELTKGSLHIKAALNEDTDLLDYFRYMTYVDYASEAKPQEMNSTVGEEPFGKGLQLWLTRTPSFNLERITAPLRIVVHGPDSFLLDNWQPYAGLRYLHKPVDLILLNPDNVNGMSLSEHVLSSPASRLLSQGGTVDWFRFWLQDYQDPDTSKTEQYTRWHELRELQQAVDESGPTR